MIFKGLPPDDVFPRNMRSLSIAWFRKEDWERWCEIDPDFQPDYDHWLRRAEEAIKHYKASGKNVQKIVIDPEDFLAWSRVNGGKVDSEARSAFAGYRAMIKDAGH